ncbi:MAG: hypothetical protein Q9172_000346 [Xanthocarpia lactea]
MSLILSHKDSATMSIPLENTLADSILRIPQLSSREIVNLDGRRLIPKLLDLNPRHEWHAYTPETISSIYERLKSSMKKPSVKEKPTKGLTVEGLHSMLSKRLFHVPDIRSFRQALGAPPGMFIIEASKPEHRPVKPDAGSINTRPSRWQAWKGDRILFISIPRSKRNNTNDYNEIQVRASQGETSNEDTNFRIPIVLDPTKFGLPLQFPTVEIRNAACYNLRSHLLKFDNDDAFQLLVSESDESWRFVLPVLEVHTDEALLPSLIIFVAFIHRSIEVDVLLTWKDFEGTSTCTDIAPDLTVFDFAAVWSEYDERHQSGCGEHVVGSGSGPGVWEWAPEYPDYIQQVYGASYVTLPRTLPPDAKASNWMTMEGLLGMTWAEGSWSASEGARRLISTSQSLQRSILRRGIRSEKKGNVYARGTLRKVFPDKVEFNGEIYTGSGKDGLYKDSTGVSVNMTELLDRRQRQSLVTVV